MWWCGSPAPRNIDHGEISNLMLTMFAAQTTYRSEVKRYENALCREAATEADRSTDTGKDFTALAMHQVPRVHRRGLPSQHF